MYSPLSSLGFLALYISLQILCKFLQQEFISIITLDNKYIKFTRQIKYSLYSSRGNQHKNIIVFWLWEFPDIFYQFTFHIYLFDLHYIYGSISSLYKCVLSVCPKQTIHLPQRKRDKWYFIYFPISCFPSDHYQTC